MISGREGLASIEQAIAGLRADEGRLDLALQSAIADAARLRQQEAEGFRTLARIKLDIMASETVVGTLDTNERRALELMQTSRASLEAITRHRTEAAAAVEAAQAEQHAKAAALEAAIEAVDQLRQRVHESIGSDPICVEAKAGIESAETVAFAADAKAKTADADLAEKRKPYESDPLFMYLWRRKHDSAEDRTGPFVRFFDRRVARLVGYADARANYVMLQEIPTRLKEHAELCKADVDKAKAKLVEAERKALEAAGIAVLEGKAQAAQTIASSAQDLVTKTTAALASIDAERQKTMSSNDPAYTQAIDLLSQALQHSDMRKLYADAFKTPTPADEQALNAITKAQEGLAKADQEVQQIRQQIQDLAKKRGELEIARDQARAKGYDSPWGTFEDHQVLAGVIGGILQGVLTSIELNQAMQAQYRERQPRTDRGFGSPPSVPVFPTPWGAPPLGPSSPPSSAPANQSGWRTGGSF